MQKLSLEKWLDRQQLSRNANLLFSDAIKCYKAEAYRASLLFSYLAFITVLKERLLGATEPGLLPAGHWQRLLDKLQDEDRWEGATFDATQEKEVIGAGKVKTKDAIFSINDNLGTQIKYWKDRRNDCAHFKDNEITTYHVASFWIRPCYPPAESS
ncbi:MAG: hypothetical protein ACRYFV_12220 [Janthinobacterium lividum]